MSINCGQFQSVQLAREYIAVADSDGMLSLIKGFYRISQPGGADEVAAEEDIDAEAKILPDVSPSSKKLMLHI